MAHHGTIPKHRTAPLLASPHDILRLTVAFQVPADGMQGQSDSIAAEPPATLKNSLRDIGRWNSPGMILFPVSKNATLLESRDTTAAGDPRPIHTVMFHVLAA